MILFLDINETLIKTGRVSLPDRLEEQRQLEFFVKLAGRLGGGPEGLAIVLLTGNSFEYTRRVEEPLGLHGLPGVRVVIVSENGLLARDLGLGDLWCLEPSEAYLEASKKFFAHARSESSLARRFITQGNELRLTLKPVANRFAPSELAAFAALAERLGTARDAQLYLHPFYVDLDPLEVRDGDRRMRLPGKAYAVERLVGSDFEGQIVAIGDSSSDKPMFEAVRAKGGRCFLVANASVEESFGVQRTAAPFTEGVNEVLAALIAG